MSAIGDAWRLNILELVCHNEEWKYILKSLCRQMGDKLIILVTE